jgi:hypothetical protein
MLRIRWGTPLHHCTSPLSKSGTSDAHSSLSHGCISYLLPVNSCNCLHLQQLLRSVMWRVHARAHAQEQMAIAESVKYGVSPWLVCHNAQGGVVVVVENNLRKRSSVNGGSNRGGGVGCSDRCKGGCPHPVQQTARGVVGVVVHFLRDTG